MNPINNNKIGYIEKGRHPKQMIFQVRCSKLGRTQSPIWKLFKRHNTEKYLLHDIFLQHLQIVLNFYSSFLSLRFVYLRNKSFWFPSQTRFFVSPICASTMTRIGNLSTQLDVTVASGNTSLTHCTAVSHSCPPPSQLRDFCNEKMRRHSRYLSEELRVKYDGWTYVSYDEGICWSRWLCGEGIDCRANIRKHCQE